MTDTVYFSKKLIRYLELQLAMHQKEQDKALLFLLGKNKKNVCTRAERILDNGFACHLFHGVNTEDLQSAVDKINKTHTPSCFIFLLDRLASKKFGCYIFNSEDDDKFYTALISKKSKKNTWADGWAYLDTSTYTDQLLYFQRSIAMEGLPVFNLFFTAFFAKTWTSSPRSSNMPETNNLSYTGVVVKKQNGKTSPHLAYILSGDSLKRKNKNNTPIPPAKENI